MATAAFPLPGDFKASKLQSGDGEAGTGARGFGVTNGVGGRECPARRQHRERCRLQAAPWSPQGWAECPSGTKAGGSPRDWLVGSLCS